ncbi:MAG TPA: phosphoribosyl-AMP cyclohydrolase [Candidatus Nanoarchaeia archaeon]|nr:phosphoribosyl-AMP cyclohydrolase [Candidatus Nanoarchaeia archaeon]
MVKNSLRETGNVLMLDFTKIKKVAKTSRRNVMRVTIQDADTLGVLIEGYINKEAFYASLRDDLATMWSTTRNILWQKGKTSGDQLVLVDVFVNCEQDSLLFKVRPKAGGACHVKDANGKTYKTCYFRRIVAREDGLGLEVDKEAMQKMA